MRTSILIALALLCVPAPASARTRRHRSRPRPAALRPAPEMLRLLVSPAGRSWTLEERKGGRVSPLIRGGRVQATRADGTEVAWSGMVRAKDGHSFTLLADDLKVVVVAQWLDPVRLPSTATLLPVAYARRPGVALRDLTLMDGAAVAGLPRVDTVMAASSGPGAVYATQAYPDIAAGQWAALYGAKRSMVAGFLSGVVGTGGIRVVTDPLGAFITARLDFVRLPVPEAGVPLDPLYLSFGGSPNTLLKQYAAGAKVFTNVLDPAPATTAQPVPGGWRSGRDWAGVREDDILANADAARALGKGIRVIQMDKGYQAAEGDWQTNDRFPHGHRWLTDRIRERGLLPGLWMDPLVVAERSTIVRDHPDWRLLDASGQPIQVGTDDRNGGTLYALDPSLPAVRSWLWALCRKATREWGYGYLHLENLSVPLRPGGVMRGGMTPAAAMRAALKAMRQGAGPTTYLMGGDAPAGAALGLLNGWRVAPDGGAGWLAVPAAALGVSAGVWMRGAWWQGAPGPVALRDPIPMDQARASAVVCAFSGGPVFLEGDLRTLTSDRLALARQSLAAPSTPAPAVLDLWNARADGMPPEVWTLPGGLSPASLTTAAVFNWSEASRTRTVTPADIASLKAGRRAHVWDVLQSRYLGTSPTLALEIPPTSCRLLTISPDTGHPQLLGIDQRLTGGAGDVVGVSWLPKYRALKVRCRTTPGAAFRLALSVPPGLRLVAVESPNATLERVADEPGCALVRATPRAGEILVTARYARAG